MKIGIIIAVIILAGIIGLTVLNKPPTMQTLIPSPSPSPQNEKVNPDSIGVNIQASFGIATGTITRNFSAQKYHNQSPDVYIENPDPTKVHVTKKGITWDDFFKTLPMKLTKDCLITGDGETLCDGKNGTLKFYLNDIETPDLLDKEIQENDKTLIKFIY